MTQVLQFLDQLDEISRGGLPALPGEEPKPPWLHRRAQYSGLDRMSVIVNQKVALYFMMSRRYKKEGDYPPAVTAGKPRRPPG